MGWETLVICKFSNKCTCTRKKEVEGLSCGFEDKHLHPINFEHAYVAELSDFIGIQQFHAACAFVEVISEGDAAGPVPDFHCGTTCGSPLGRVAGASLQGRICIIP